MAAADGKFAEEEKTAMAIELAKFGVTEPSEVTSLFSAAASMELEQASAFISNLDNERKKYVCGYLAVIMAADGEVDDRELAVWQIVSVLCQLPSMTLSEALDFWVEN